MWLSQFLCWLRGQLPLFAKMRLTLTKFENCDCKRYEIPLTDAYVFGPIQFSPCTIFYPMKTMKPGRRVERWPDLWQTLSKDSCRWCLGRSLVGQGAIAVSRFSCQICGKSLRVLDDIGMSHANLINRHFYSSKSVQFLVESGWSIVTWPIHLWAWHCHVIFFSRMHSRFPWPFSKDIPSTADSHLKGTEIDEGPREVLLPFVQLADGWSGRGRTNKAFESRFIHL